MVPPGKSPQKLPYYMLVHLNLGVEQVIEDISSVPKIVSVTSRLMG